MRAPLRTPPGVQRRTAGAKFLQKMLPFISKLPARRAEREVATSATQFASIERVTASVRLGRHRPEITIDGGQWRCMRPETPELRMMTISRDRTAEYRTREQRLAPERNQTPGVEIARM